MENTSLNEAARYRYANMNNEMKSKRYVNSPQRTALSQGPIVGPEVISLSRDMHLSILWTNCI